MTHLILSVLGALQVSVEGEPVKAFRTAKTRALLVYLALESNRPHSRDALAGLLWPDQPNQTARDNLRQTLAILRKAIGDSGNAQSPSLDITRDTIQFNPGSDHFVDAVAFTTLLNACATHPHRHSETCRSCAASRLKAVELYRGDFIDQFYLNDSAPFEEWALLKRERLRALALETLYQLAEFHTVHGDHQQALAFALRQLELDPWCEEAHRQAMRALALDGQHSAALAQYEHCQRRLADELGVAPAQETIALYEVIKAQAVGIVENNSPSPLLFRFPVCNLPSPVTPLLGRVAELADLDRLLSDPGCRLISIVGPGGAGKTRLAIAAAAEKKFEFKDGVFFVSLASLDSADLLAPTLLVAIGAPSQGQRDSVQQLFNYLREREVLLVLDNLEHLLEGTQLLAELLRRAPRVALLVTSRERLNLHGEWVLDLRGLEVPEGEKVKEVERYSAVQLFVQSARRDRGVSLFSDEEKSTIVRICRMVEGMPLAIELAAAWVRTLSCRQIADEIEKSFGFLTTALRDVPQRHRSMRAVFEHSWNLLNVDERGALRRLAVFHGGFQREAAEQVAAASLPLLATLVDKSLVRRMDTGRYDLHELIRQYAREQLMKSGDFDDACDRHLDFFLKLTEEAEPKLRDAEQLIWIDSLEQEQDNLRAALEWSLGNKGTAVRMPQAPLRLAGALYFFWKRRAHWSEGREWLRHALAQATALPATREYLKALNAAVLLAADQADTKLAWQLAQENLALARELKDAGSIARSLNSLGFVLWKKKDFTSARASCEQALELWREQGDRLGSADALHNLSHIAINQSDYEAAQIYCSEAAAIYRELGDGIGLTDALGDLGLVAYLRNDHVAARSYLEESLARFRRAASVPGIVSALNRSGDLARCQGDYAQAEILYAECLALYRDVGDKDEFPSLLHNLAYAVLHRGDYLQAMALFKEGLAIQWEMNNQAGIAECLAGIAGVLATQGQAERGARLFGVSEALRETASADLWPANRVEHDRLLALLHESLGENLFAAAWAAGRSVPTERAVREALEQNGSS